MKSSSDLRSMLKNIDRKGYPAYKGTYGIYDFGNYYLSIDHVQGDPFASPSKLSIEVKGKKAGFPAEFYNAKYKRIALCDHLTRLFYNALSKIFSCKRFWKKWVIFYQQMWTGSFGTNCLYDQSFKWRYFYSF